MKAILVDAAEMIRQWQQLQAERNELAARVADLEAQLAAERGK